VIEENVREVGLVALMLVVGGAIMWLADHWGGQTRDVDAVTFPIAVGIGAAQAIALVPGVSRSGISISAARFAGLNREAAARFSFLMATPVTAGAALFEFRKLLTGEAGIDVAAGPLIVGMVSAFVSGILAIGILLRYLRTRSLNIFVAYRFVLAAIVVVVWLR
jgi:undecaprenyl-diphosphatase